jgi:hypothetical protein
VGHQRLEPPAFDRLGDALAGVGIGVRDEDEALAVEAGAGLGGVRRCDVLAGGFAEAGRSWALGGGIGTTALEALVPMNLPSRGSVLMGFVRLPVR